MLILSLGAIPASYAQTESEPDDPVTTIMEESNGNVVIDIPQPILDQILTPVETPKRQNQHLKPGINKMTGYRIQVFSDGRNQGSLEARAKARGSAVLAKFPKYRGQVYTFSQSPSLVYACRQFPHPAGGERGFERTQEGVPVFRFGNEGREV